MNDLNNKTNNEHIYTSVSSNVFLCPHVLKLGYNMTWFFLLECLKFFLGYGVFQYHRIGFLFREAWRLVLSSSLDFLEIGKTLWIEQQYNNFEKHVLLISFWQKNGSILDLQCYCFILYNAAFILKTDIRPRKVENSFHRSSKKKVQSHKRYQKKKNSTKNRTAIQKIKIFMISQCPLFLINQFRWIWSGL